MRGRLALVLFSGLLLAADTPSEQAVKEELAKLKGTWSLKSLEQGGMQFPGTGSLVIADNKYTQKEDGETVEDGTIKVDPSKKPPTIDMVIASGKDKGKTQLGIYELKDDTLKFCLGLPGAEKKAPAKKDEAP